MDELINKEIKRLQRTRDFSLAYTSSLLVGSFVVAKHGTFFFGYFPLFQEELQKTEQFLNQPGMGLAVILTTGIIYVSGIATLIHDYYETRIEKAQKRELF